MQFNSLGQLGIHLATRAVSQYNHNLKTSLKGVGNAVADRARKSVGTYQAAIGPFPAWEPLSQATMEKKARKGWGLGGNPASPLYATGHFRNSIAVKIDGHAQSVSIGTNDEKIIYTELGTSKMPPRPVFGPAALSTVPKYAGAFAAAGACAIVNRSFAVEAFTDRGTHFSGDIS